MLGDKIGEETGHVKVQRVLPNPGGIPKMETTFEATGTILGAAHKTTGTYTSMLRPDGTVYGEGAGLVMGKEGEMASGWDRASARSRRTAASATAAPSTTRVPHPSGLA
jgi:hypothetical protein